MNINYEASKEANELMDKLRDHGYKYQGAQVIQGQKGLTSVAIQMSSERFLLTIDPEKELVSVGIYITDPRNGVRGPQKLCDDNGSLFEVKFLLKFLAGFPKIIS